MRWQTRRSICWAGKRQDQGPSAPTSFSPPRSSSSPSARGPRVRQASRRAHRHRHRHDHRRLRLVAGIVSSTTPGCISASEATRDARIRRVLLDAAPKLMKMLMVIGTAAMFLVGGGILVHGVPRRASSGRAAAHAAATVPASAARSLLSRWLIDALAGIAAARWYWASSAWASG